MLRKILQWLEDLLPDPVGSFLGQEFFGNSLLQYIIYLTVILIGWALSYSVSFGFRRLVGIIASRFSRRFAVGLVKAITGPVRVIVICGVAVIGANVLTQRSDDPPPDPAELDATAAETAQEPAAADPEESPTPVAADESGQSVTIPARDGVSVTVTVTPENEISVKIEGDEEEIAKADAFISSGNAWDFNPSRHWVHWVLHSLAALGLWLSIFWMFARILAFLWDDYLNPWVGRTVKGPEAKYFVVIYKALKFGLWVFGIITSISALGYDTVALVHQILAYQAANNSISQFLGFLLLVLFAFLMARTLFNLFTKQFVRFVRRSGAEVKQVEDTWFSGLERPAIYFISLLGARVACNVLTQAPPGEVQELVFAIATRAVHVALTANLTWIAFILIDKAWEHFLLPLAIAAEAIDEQLVILARKVAKIGVAVIGFIFMIKSFGQDPGTVLAGLGIGGLAVSFAAKDSLSPILSGVVIHLTKPFRINDYIVVGDADEGVVEEIDMRTTVLSQRDGSRLIVPNDKLTTSVLRNFTTDGLTTDKIHLSIDVATPPDKRDEAIEMLKSTALEVDGVQEADLVFLAYQEDALEWDLLYRVENPRLLNPVRTTIMLLIDARLRELGVEIDMPSMLHSFSSYLEEQPDMRKLIRDTLTGDK